MRGQQAYRPVQSNFHSGNEKDLLVLVFCGAGAGSPSIFVLFFKRFAMVVDGGGFYDSWDLSSQEILRSLRNLTYEAEQTLYLPRQRSRQGAGPWLST